ncbi:hypothetical protein, partial [uncultured Planktosalinus sp.]|uniref:hypothetical protein n=1 Tax=uncultured Planktosalinus sp. TaxID=1810935 RepID=UPI0030DBA862
MRYIIFFLLGLFGTFAQESNTEKVVFHYLVTLTQPESLSIQTLENGRLEIKSPLNSRENRLFKENYV